MNSIILNQAQLEHLFSKYYSPLCQLSYSIVKNMDASKDIVQDFFIKYWERYANEVPPGNFEAYAFVSVRHRSLNYIESQDVKIRHESHVRRSIYPEASVAASHEQEYRENYRIRLLQAINQLPKQRRHVFMLSAVEGMKYADIARQMNISINTVKTQIKKAYVSIRKDCAVKVLLVIALLLNRL
ncbi:RNA polymerase sigma-70 factor [Chitinophaga oryzae]|uniref:RNA polymerase sigma-70 factor n=1 Tax=Chitinophaga oryzae TaxID=2725414 RepID=A0AAE6ZJJ1_9BACT|nr:RNA polymerase sigma-70 factor [Chitinophaga oryzae]QJB32569.1 RNA polymerase sigma-70 factor [Chitinophaga oryzae]